MLIPGEGARNSMLGEGEAKTGQEKGWGGYQ